MSGLLWRACIQDENAWRVDSETLVAAALVMPTAPDFGKRLTSLV